MEAIMYTHLIKLFDIPKLCVRIEAFGNYPLRQTEYTCNYMQNFMYMYIPLGTQ